jgi:hypothetical protein
MINVNQITSTLRGMADRALQQYAMMNKGNPYILSLAVAESNQRKQLRTAAQARMAAPQPKVADAAIAGIAEATPSVDAMGNVTGMAAGGLPEDYGIGRLPARNIERMADGGIAGYGDGDDVPRQNGMAQGGMYDFAQRSEPVVRMAGGGAVEFSKGGGGLTEMRKLVLKELGETSTNYLQDPEVKRTVDKLVQERLGTTATTATAAKPTAAPAAAPTKSFEAGQKYGPTLRKVGDTLSDIGTTKTSKLPIGGAAKTAGVLGALPAGYEAYQQGDFYNDPNVSSFGKAKQALGTAAKVGIPMLTTGVGSLVGPGGTFGGMLAGGALTTYLDQTGRLTSQEYEDWLKANPQATPEQTKKAAAKFVPTYSPNDQDNSEAKRLGLKVNPNTMSKPIEAKEPSDTGGAGGQGGGAGGQPAAAVQGVGHRVSGSAGAV